MSGVAESARWVRTAGGEDSVLEVNARERLRPRGKQRLARIILSLNQQVAEHAGQRPEATGM